MKLLDRIAFNRLVAIIANFILSLIKIIYPKIEKEIYNPIPNTPPTKKLKPFQWITKKLKNEK
jgi:hypothetical protein